MVDGPTAALSCGQPFGNPAVATSQDALRARAGFALVFQELAAAGEEHWFAYSYWFCCFLASIFFSSSSTFS